MADPFRIRLGGNVIELHPQFDFLRQYCADYLTEAEADIEIRVSRNDIAREREISAAECALEGIPVNRYPDRYLETLAAYRQIAEALIERDMLLFHASAIAVDGEAYLFAARSGTGKSTHARLWREQFGQRAHMVNDDKPMLQYADGRTYVCGTPWNGKYRLGQNETVPVKAICLLHRAEENSIRPVTRREVLPLLMQQSYRPETPEKLRKMMLLLDKLTQSTALYSLGCNMQPEAALVSYNGMNGGNDHEAERKFHNP